MLTANALSFAYSNGAPALDQLTLAIKRGEKLAILGANGAGKSTLLTMLNGSLRPDAGQVELDGKPVGYDRAGLLALRARVGLVLQDPDDQLFAATVAEDVSFGPLNMGLSADQARRRVEEALHSMGISALARRPTHMLSFGQRKRVAIAGILAMRPSVLLLDEPLGALDKKLREHTQFEIANIQHKTGITFVVVTHDQEEAMTLASRIAVMDRGVVRQIGTATDVYEYPNSRFVAGFIGSINLFEGEVMSVTDGLATVRVPQLGIDVTGLATRDMAAGQKIAAAIRPEKIFISREPPQADGNTLQGTVDDLGYFGKDSLYRIRLDTGTILQVNSVNARRRPELERVAQWEDKVWLTFDPSAVILLRD